MKREGQFWLAFFALLIGVPLVMGVCAVWRGDIQAERERVEKSATHQP